MSMERCWRRKESYNRDIRIGKNDMGENFYRQVFRVDVVKAAIIQNRQLKMDCCFLELDCPGIAASCWPGQFVMLRPTTNIDPYLGRPLAIAEVDVAKGSIGLIYRLVGKGTRQLQTLTVGTEIPVVGPLGNGFELDLARKKAVIIAGGVGISPMLYLAKTLKEKGCALDFILGAKSADDILGSEQLSRMGVSPAIATEDGSLGYAGFPTAILAQSIEKEKPSVVYCCGPWPMMAAVSRMAQANGVPCQVSLETRMGCGIGVCVGCVCQVQNNLGEMRNAKVCNEGPVFSGEEVIWHG